MSPPELSIVLPIYNEVGNIRPLVEEIDEVLTKAKRSYEIVAVDDGSNDGTRQLLKELASERPEMRVVLFRRNAGQAAAFDAGLRHATAPFVVTMDADMQNDPRDIPAMLAKLDDGYDLISGWRKNRKDGLILRKIPSRVANFLIRKITGTPIRDLGCSLKVYRKEITDELRLYGEMHRFIAVLAGHAGARIGEMEVNHRERHAGVSKYGIARTFKVLLDLLTVWFMHSFQTKPIYVFGGIGSLMIASSGLLSGVVLYERLRWEIYVHRNPLFTIGVLLFTTGIQLLGVGLLAEIIVRTYFESRGRPAYVVAERIGFSKPAAKPGDAQPEAER